MRETIKLCEKEIKCILLRMIYSFFLSGFFLIAMADAFLLSLG